MESLDIHADHYLIMPNTELLLICDSEYSVAPNAVSAFPSVNVCLPKNDHGVRWLIDLALEGSALPGRLWQSSDWLSVGCRRLSARRDVAAVAQGRHTLVRTSRCWLSSACDEA